MCPGGVGNLAAIEPTPSGEVDHLGRPTPRVKTIVMCFIVISSVPSVVLSVGSPFSVVALFTTARSDVYFQNLLPFSALSQKFIRYDEQARQPGSVVPCWLGVAIPSLSKDQPAIPEAQAVDYRTYSLRFNWAVEV